MKKICTIFITLILAFILAIGALALEIYEIPTKVEIPENAYGVLQIPCIGTESPLYQGRQYQDIIDDEDSALFYKYKRGWLVADHAGSEVGNGTWYVEDLQVGCAAFLIRKDQPTLAYICTSIQLCHQNGWNYTYHRANVNPTANGLICVSCSNEENWVFVAIFEYVEEMP